MQPTPATEAQPAITPPPENQGGGGFDPNKYGSFRPGGVVASCASRHGHRMSLGTGEAARAGSVIPPGETMARVMRYQQQWRDRCQGALRRSPGAGEVAGTKGALPAETMSRVRILQQRNRQPDVNLPSRVDPPSLPVEKPNLVEGLKGKMRTFRAACKKLDEEIGPVVRLFLLGKAMLDAFIALGEWLLR